MLGMLDVGNVGCWECLGKNRELRVLDIQRDVNS
jgi:hypothetical protein